MTKKAFCIQLITCMLITSISCKHDKPIPKPITTLCEVSFSADIQPIINNKCAVPTCHDGSSALPDFNNYAILKSRADNGRLRSFVFDLKIMPPANAMQLNNQEKEQIKCWLDNGAPQN